MKGKSEMREVQRYPVAQTTLDFYCTVCGKEQSLYFNGGELDSLECCGNIYALESTGVEFVQYAPALMVTRSDT